MKLKHLASLSLFILFLASCKKEVANKAVTPVKTDTLAPLPEPKSSYDKFQELINRFINHRDAVKAKLPSLTPSQADALYDNYNNGQLISEIEKLEQSLITNYYKYFYYRERRISPPDSIQKKAVLLEKAGLEIWDIGEDIRELRTVPAFYFDIFKKYVTEDYREYLRIQAEDDAVLFDNDGAINIPLQDVSKRVLNWENFIAKYPASKKIPDAKETYKFYQSALLLGADNTPAIEYETSKLDPYFLSEFNSFATKHPDSFTTTLIHLVINNQDKGYEVLTAEIEKEQQKYLDVK